MGYKILDVALFTICKPASRCIIIENGESIALSLLINKSGLYVDCKDWRARWVYGTAVQGLPAMPYLPA